MKVAITGASGYLGKYLKKTLGMEGWTIIGLQREVAGIELGEQCIQFDLDKDFEFNLSGVDAVIHCAYDFSKKGWEAIKNTNIERSKLFFDLAKHSKVRFFFFISSLSAFEGCKSNYGAAKLEVEKYVVDNGGTVIKPGLITGEPMGGIVKILANCIKYAPILPVPYDKNTRLSITDEIEIASTIKNRVKANATKPEVIPVVTWSNLKLEEVLERIGKKKGLKLPVLLNVPPRLFHYALLLLETIYPNSRIGSDNLISLINTAPLNSRSISLVSEE